MICEIRRVNSVGMMYVPKRFREEVGIRDGGAVVVELAERGGEKVLILRPLHDGV